MVEVSWGGRAGRCNAKAIDIDSEDELLGQLPDSQDDAKTVIGADDDTCVSETMGGFDEIKDQDTISQVDVKDIAG